ncbi:MAG: Crp/Fnr family transcriptional regulator [Gammaproteobacteria bacterium]|nr:MAG: Crp/Fnr family transcriptional regulator [Gammaproteobacteria bacterium]
MASNTIKEIKFNDFILNQMCNCALVKPMKDSCFEEIKKSSLVLQLTDNSVLFEQGSDLKYIYLVISGSIKLTRLIPTGDEKVIDIILPGNTFAEAALFFGNQKYPVTAVSAVPSVVVAFDARNYIKLLKSSNDLCINLLGYISKRLNWMVNEVERLTMHNATFRLVDYLLSQVSEESKQTTFSLTAPKHVIASRLSIKPETLSRTLKDLNKRGLINYEGTRIELVDIEQLRHLVSLEV